MLGECVGVAVAHRRNALAARRASRGYTQERLAEALGVERSTIHRWESGEVVPRADLQPTLARALGITPAELANLLGADADVNHMRGATSSSRASTAGLERTGAGRRACLGDGFAEIGDDPGEFLAATVVETPLPSRLGWTEVEHVRATARTVAMSENLFGGGLSAEASAAQLRWAGQLLDIQAPSQVRRCAAEAVGNLASVVAFSAFDIANYDAADRCFEFALWCADEANSWALRANTLAEMARKAAYLGKFDAALELIEFAEVRLDRLTDTARAMLATIRARLLALTGRHVEAEADVDRADVHFAERDHELDPPWLCYYDVAEHQGSTGKALIPVAQDRGNPDLAMGRLNAAIRLQAADYPRSRAFSRIRLASLMMAAGYPGEAVPVGRQAVSDTAALRSKRLTTELRGLARAATVHARLSDVTELRQDIAALARSAT